MKSEGGMKNLKAQSRAAGRGEQDGHAPYRGGREGPRAASFKARGEEALCEGDWVFVAGAPLPPPPR